VATFLRIFSSQTPDVLVIMMEGAYMMSQRSDDLVYRCLYVLQRRRASRPDANHIRFELDYQAWQRAEPGTEPDKVAHSSDPPHLSLEEAYNYTHQGRTDEEHQESKYNDDYDFLRRAL
jgi:hypothetical protein